MEAKSQEAYTTLLRKCKQLFPFLTPTKIMTDFEAGLQNALSDVYPEAERNACWFHYVQVRAT